MVGERADGGVVPHDLGVRLDVVLVFDVAAQRQRVDRVEPDVGEVGVDGEVAGELLAIGDHARGEPGLHVGFGRDRFHVVLQGWVSRARRAAPARE